jgi:hypothetical protein
MPGTPVRALTPALMLVLAATAAPSLVAQQVPAPLPTWRASFRVADTSRPPLATIAAGRSRATTGLLIGAAIGAAATTVFLLGFCSDPDTTCQADEVARAALIIGVPFAAAGALIGALSRSD